MASLLDTLRLIRFFNCLLAGLGVIIGARMTWLYPVSYAPVMAALAAFLVCAAGNIVNDWFDIDIDRINRPDRVLVRGGLSRPFALTLAISASLAALGIAFTINYDTLAMVAAAILIIFFYNFKLKRIPILGNSIVALSAALTFITGGLAVDREMTFYLPGPLVAAAFAFLLHLIRELVKDVQDIDGDVRMGIRTLPAVIGVSRTLLVAISTMVALTVLTLLPVFLGWFGPIYKIVVVYFIDLPLLVILIFTWGNPSEQWLKVTSVALKIAMGLGLLALALG